MYREELHELFGRLARRDAVRSEATIQADVRQLLLTGEFNLSEQDLEVHLETQIGDGRRIDIEVGFSAIEIKKDLRSATLVRQVEQNQLRGYVATRSLQTGQKYAGILTDGAEWRAYHLRGDALELATQFTLSPARPDGDGLLLWLEGVLSTSQGIKPTPREIDRRLGADSPSHALDRATLAALYDEHRNLPTVQLKRHLWSRLLRSALGTQFPDDDALFIEHTLLVNSAELIAHLVLGLRVTEMEPSALLRGRSFEQAGIRGVVEEDFFDWVLEVPGGESMVRTFARRLARFDWSRVEHDVLKVLYESVIGAETRRNLGEYYTPDWLAEHMVGTMVTDPLAQRVLDPSCGSGTFLFYAVRRYLDAAFAAGIPLAQALNGLAGHVIGIDLHPVAVALARVTYLLAIGRERLTSRRGPISVPVYLGDSVQWQQRLDLLDHDHLVIHTSSSASPLEEDLRFPEHLLADAVRFERIVVELAALAQRPDRTRGSVPVRALQGLFHRLVIAPEDQSALTGNFSVLCGLVDEGRDHVWSYYVRNLARPMWLSRPENRVDVLVGNPPWLSYRNMPREMQERFKELSQERGLWHGNESATHQDLSGLFIARAIQQYLSEDGRFAFVVPNAVLDRPYFAGFRSGRYHAPSESVEVVFTGSWDLRRLRPHFFPRACGVVFGRRTGVRTAEPLPTFTEQWTGKVPRDAHDWQAAAPLLAREPATLTLVGDSLIESPYGPRFSQGASIVPRMLFFVEERGISLLGTADGSTLVHSERSNTEKAPWKNLPGVNGAVENEFLYPVLLGESILPYRVLPPRTVVLPLEGRTLMGSQHPDLDLHPGLADWWRSVERLWNTNRASERLTLLEQLDFRRKLTAQLPATPLRLVYAKAGMHVSAALVDNDSAVIDHKLYWGAVASREEGMYLCAILNTAALTNLVRPLMSYGKDERDIDKVLWKLPIPLYDPAAAEHRRLAELGAMEAERIKALNVDETSNFVTLRRIVRNTLITSPHAEEFDQLVTVMLGH